MDNNIDATVFIQYNQAVGMEGIKFTTYTYRKPCTSRPYQAPTASGWGQNYGIKTYKGTYILSSMYLIQDPLVPEEVMIEIPVDIGIELPESVE